jgi:hypothetical protein
MRISLKFRELLKEWHPDLCKENEGITALEPIREGHGEGFFVVISAQKEETILRR